MRKPLVVGILNETKQGERRAAVTPKDAAWLKNRSISIEVESSPGRIFTDKEYERAGARIVSRCRAAGLLVGVKEPEVESLQPDKIYMVFSHTIKGQKENMPLLRACLKNNITLIDYEKIMDADDRRLAYFGKFAGLAGCVDSLCYFGRKLESRGIRTPFSLLKPSGSYKRLVRAKVELRKVSEEIKREGFGREVAPLIIGITGHGNVCKGVKEILEIFRPVEIHPRDMAEFIRQARWKHNRVYQIVFDREEKLRAKNGSGFYFEEYLKDPKRFESNMDVYLPFINILIHTSYWEENYPRLVPKGMVHRISRGDSRLEFIGDISCDIRGSIELTYKTTTEDQPVYTYNPRIKVYIDGYDTEGITILARDNLPAQFPEDSSREFSGLVKEYIYQIAAHGVYDVANHAAISREIRRAVITQGRRLSGPYAYLKKFLG